jgi:hypothetical protein
LPATPEIDLHEYAGVFRGEVTDVTIEAEDDRLILLMAGERIALDPMTSPAIPDAFVTDHPALALFPLRFERDATGSVAELTHGSDWYATDAYDGARTFETSPAWAAFPGHYRSYNPWFANFRVVVRKGELRLINPRGTEQILVPDGHGFRIGDDTETPERIVFDTIVEGEALRARLAGGAAYYRFFTP